MITSEKAARGWLQSTRLAPRIGIDSPIARTEAAYAAEILDALANGNARGVSEEAWAWIRKRTVRGDKLHKQWATTILELLVGISDRETIETKPSFDVEVASA